MPDTHGIFSHASTTPRVRREERIKIRKGEIVKETVWLDTQGNELEMIRGGEFQVRPQPTTFRKAPIIRGYPDPPINTQTIPIELQFYPKKQSTVNEPYYYQPSVIIVTCVAFLFWFLAGYALGRRVMVVSTKIDTIKVASEPTEVVTVNKPTENTIN